MEEQGNKGVLSTIFGGVDNHELDLIFTGLDKIFDIITAEINIELPHELSGHLIGAVRMSFGKYRRYVAVLKS